VPRVEKNVAREIIPCVGSVKLLFFLGQH